MTPLKEMKKDMFIRRTKEILTQYAFNPTIRQIYYRLVSAQDIPNSAYQYSYFNKVLTSERKKDLIFADCFIDKTRTLYDDIDRDYALSLPTIIKNRFHNIKTYFPKIEYSGNNLQSDITIILLEKQALESVFFEILEKKFGYILVVARGFNSFTQMNELRHLVENEDRSLHLCIFGDYDDSGNVIKENFIYQCETFLGIHFDTIRDIALNEEQIHRYALPKNPTKKKGKKESSHRIHQKNKGIEVDYYVELDALEPIILQQLLETEVDRYVDYDLYNAMNKALSFRNRRFEKIYFKKLRKLDLTKV